MRSLFALVLAVVGCGRVGFDAIAPPGAGSDADATRDPIGCADGTREAFADQAAFPTLAGCGASWVGGADLRSPATGAACGNTLGMCASPADACAAGWHVCMTSGDPRDLSDRITSAQCTSAGGTPGVAFAAASDHCASCDGGCNLREQCHYDATYDCRTPSESTFCTEAMCCGDSCNGGPMCRDAFFGIDGNTSSSTTCGAASSAALTGVLCCAD